MDLVVFGAILKSGFPKIADRLGIFLPNMRHAQHVSLNTQSQQVVVHPSKTSWACGCVARAYGKTS